MTPIAQSIANAVVTGTGSFVATNLDDLLVLMVLFARADRQTQDRQILLGRYLGFGAIVLASLVGFWGGLFLPPWVIGLLGFGPIAIGISQLRDRKTNQSDHTFLPEPQTLADPWDQSPQRSPQKPNRSRFRRRLLQRWCSPQALQVATVTIACGADNIGVYIPLFAACNGLELMVVLFTFAIGVGLLFWVARRFSRQRMVFQWIDRFGHQLAPWVLIALGVWILWESGLLNFRIRL